MGSKQFGFKGSISCKLPSDNLLHLAPLLDRGLMDTSSQNCRQIFVIVFTESRSSSEKCRNVCMYNFI